MILGETITAPGDIVLNDGRPVITLTIANTGDHPSKWAATIAFSKPTPRSGQWSAGGD